MNAAASRQSACDRCRGQKLRCVRQSEDENVPCDRCAKASAECINTLSTSKRDGSRFNERSKPARVSPHPRSASESYSDQSFQLLQHFDIDKSSTIDVRALALPQSGQRRKASPDALQRPSKKVFADISSAEIQTNELGANNLLVVPRQKQYFGQQRRHDSGPSFDDGLLIGRHNLSNNLGGISTETIDVFGNGVLDVGGSLEPGVASHVQHNFSNLATGMDLREQLAPHSVAGYESVSECLQGLADLSGRLMKHAHDYEHSCKTLTDLLSFPPSGTHSLQPSKNAIGSVLESSQTFLSLLYSLKTLLGSQLQSAPPASPADSECSYSDLWGTFDFPPNNDLSSTASLAPISEGSAGVGTRKSPTSGRSSHSHGTSVQNKGTSTPETPLDMPTTLTTLACYTWLLHIYETILSRIQGALSGGTMSAMPNIVPGLTVGGFSLEQRKDLQIEIFLQLSSNLMARTEEIIYHDAQKASSGVHYFLDTTAINALAGMIFQEDERPSGLAVRVRRQVDVIRNRLHQFA
jgi:hypothetical protein